MIVTISMGVKGMHESVNNLTLHRGVSSEKDRYKDNRNNGHTRPLLQD